MFGRDIFTFAPPLAVVENKSPFCREKVLQDHCIIRLVYPKDALLNVVVNHVRLGHTDLAVLVPEIQAGAVLNVCSAQAPFAVHDLVGFLARGRFLVTPTACSQKERKKTIFFNILFLS